MALPVPHLANLALVSKWTAPAAIHLWVMMFTESALLRNRGPVAGAYAAIRFPLVTSAASSVRPVIPFNVAIWSKL